MKKILPGLLMFFGLALCGLCAFQWVREAHLRAEIVTLHDTVFDKTKMVQGLEGNLRRTEAEVARLEALKTELTDTVKTNRLEILNLSRRADALERQSETLKSQVEAYKAGLDQANQNITKQNEDIKRQNDEMKKLADERNGSVVKFNKLVEQYNEVVQQYNKLQEDMAKAVAAAAPAK